MAATGIVIICIDTEVTKGLVYAQGFFLSIILNWLVDRYSSHVSPQLSSGATPRSGQVPL